MFGRTDHAAGPGELVTEVALSVLTLRVGLAAPPHGGLRVRMRAGIGVELFGLGRNRRFCCGGA